MSASRKQRELSRGVQGRLLAALRQVESTGDLVSLRTGAFASLLLDGSVRTRAALGLDVQHVLSLPHQKLVVAAQARTGDGALSLSDRTRTALRTYLRAARSEKRLQVPGPLFVSIRGKGRRLSQRTAVQAWHTFWSAYLPDEAPYQLDDLVFSGRMAFLRAADGDAEALAQHAHISIEWANQYRAHLSTSRVLGAREVLARVERSRQAP